MEDKYIEELFALPIGLELEASVDGQKFYSSQKLKESFLKSLGASGRVTKYYNQIEKLVIDKRLIVPCYLSKNMFRFFKHKMFGNPEDKSILGFYHLSQKRVFILIDNTISPFGTGKNDFLASTTIHECVHLYADRMKSRFLSTFKQELERYYISYFSRVFRLDKKIDVMPIVKFISVFEYKRSNNLNKQLMSYYDLIVKYIKPYTTLDEKEFTNRLNALIVCIKLSLVNFPAFIRMFRQYKVLFEPLDRAYQEAFGTRNLYTTPYQELSSVSEVICVLSEMKPQYPKIVKMFKEMA